MGTVGIYLPHYLGLLNEPVHITGGRGTGVLLLLLGAYIALRSAFSFAWIGQGTPFPLDPPRHLVVTGLYRHVRNPMYTGMAFFLIGEWLMFGSNLRGALIYFAFYAVAVTLFVHLYEEPTLRRKFPDEYAEYFRNVPRFIPRFDPWDPPQTKSATPSRS